MLSIPTSRVCEERGVDRIDQGLLSKSGFCVYAQLLCLCFEKKKDDIVA